MPLRPAHPPAERLVCPAGDELVELGKGLGWTNVEIYPDEVRRRGDIDGSGVGEPSGRMVTR